jgi:hypothetical protein
MTWAVKATVAPPDYEGLRLACRRAQIDLTNYEQRQEISTAMDMAVLALVRRCQHGHEEEGERYSVKLSGSGLVLRCDVRRLLR